MPKPIINNKIITDTKLSVNKENIRQDNKEYNLFKQYIRQKRSKEYIACINKLDAGSSLDNKNTIDNIINTLKKDFPMLCIYPPSNMLGIVACCYLGKNFEVHMLSLAGYILQHFKKGNPLPGKLEKARSLAMSEMYAFIEVYEDCMCAISENGTVSIISF